MQTLKEFYNVINNVDMPVQIAKRAIRKTELDHPEYKLDHVQVTSYIKRAIGEVKSLIKEEINK